MFIRNRALCRQLIAASEINYRLLNTLPPYQMRSVLIKWERRHHGIPAPWQQVGAMLLWCFSLRSTY